MIVDNVDWLGLLFLHFLPVFLPYFFFKGRDCSHPYLAKFLSFSPQLVDPTRSVHQKKAFFFDLFGVYICQFICFFGEVEGIIDILVADFGPILQNLPVPISHVFILLLKADEKRSTLFLQLPLQI